MAYIDANLDLRMEKLKNLPKLINEIDCEILPS